MRNEHVILVVISEGKRMMRHKPKSNDNIKSDLGETAFRMWIEVIWLMGLQ